MRARLAVAGALLGEPDILVLDEPASGLDFQGQRWLHELLAAHAANGGTVLLSSHDLAALSRTADRAVFIEAGRIVGEEHVDELLERGAASLRVTVSDPPRLADVLRDLGADVSISMDGGLIVRGISSPEVGAAAQREGLVVSGLAPDGWILEDAARNVTGAS